jgi:LAO/AO transport system kinase
LNIDQLAKDILKGQNTALARGITLMESQRLEDWPKAKELLEKTKNHKNTFRRLGFSGPPGVGKSTFIEKMGMKFIEQGDSVAVLAIDPSSRISGGSILGDKTRMENLSRHERAFVRPSPTRGHLGGVTSSLHGVIQLCGAAGYQWILIESVGVGQSEVELAQMVEIFTLLALPGAGDELQGIKKGILEYVDLIVVNKADRDPEIVNATRQQLLGALKIMGTGPVKILPCSALKDQGLEEVKKEYEEIFKNDKTQDASHFSEHWYESLVSAQLKQRIFSHLENQKRYEDLKEKVSSGNQTAFQAVEDFFKNLKL